MESIVSIIVPVYNAEKFIDKCVNSIVNQTYRNLEIILVNDGSSDNSAKKCDEWAQKDSRVKVIHKENAGAGEARNTGLECASGEYIFFVDSDDYIAENTVEKCVVSVKEHHTDAVVFSSSCVFGDGTVSRVKVNPEKTFFDKEAVKTVLIPSFMTLSLGYDVGIWGKLYSAKIIKDNSIRFLSEREFYSEDTLFLLQYFAKCESVSAVAENLYYYYENEASLSRRYSKEREENLNNFILKALDIAKEEDLGKQVELHLMARYHGCAMVEYKNVVLSDMTPPEKLRVLKSKYKNPILQSTLKKEVFAVEKRTLSLFYSLVKLRFYYLSYLLLRAKLRKN